MQRQPESLGERECDIAERPAVQFQRDCVPGASRNVALLPVPKGTAPQCVSVVLRLCAAPTARGSGRRAGPAEGAELSCGGGEGTVW